MVEALLRWDRGIPIDRVVLGLERNGLIEEATLFVITTVCSHMRQLKASIGYSPKVAINISPLLFHTPWFVSEARRIIECNEIPPSMIEFEITESRIVHNIDVVSKAATELRNEGFGIALDDFGTGFSGLRYLDLIPASALKIDRHFVSGLGERQTCDTIVASVARLAADTGVIAVAEGIETQFQLNTVVSMGYDELQGYLLAKPIPFSELVPFLRQFNHDQVYPVSAALHHSHLLEGCL